MSYHFLFGPPPKKQQIIIKFSNPSTQIQNTELVKTKTTNNIEKAETDPGLNVYPSNSTSS